MATRDTQERLGSLAMEGMDEMRAQYGDAANMADALLLIEVAVADPDEPSGYRLELISKCTTYRATTAVGIAHLYLESEHLVQDDEG